MIKCVGFFLPTCFMLLTLSMGSNYNEWSEETDKQHFPNNDFSRIITDFWSKLGLKHMMNDIGERLKISVRIGQAYKWKHFKRDWRLFKENPGIRNFIYFLRQVTWPAIVNSIVAAIESVTQAQNYILRFLKKKLDIYLGKDAVFHPWNLMMEQDQQQVSFLVFVYGVALSLIMIKILSWWNFMVYLALGFLAYSFGGPYLVFKWLLCITGIFWLIFDLVLTYPLQVAVVIICIFVINYVRHLLPASSKNSRNTQKTTRLVRQNTNAVRHNSHVTSKPDAEEMNLLKARLDGMEQKTDLLTQKLEQLTQAMETLQSDAEDEN